jgi:hypothetical protein
METEQVSKTLDFNPTVMQLITKKNSEHNPCCGSLKS